MKSEIEENTGKSEKLIFSKVFLIVAVIFFINIGMQIFSYWKGSKVTGLSVGETIVELYNNIPITTRIFIGAQWVILLFLLIFVYIKDKKIKVMKDEVEKIDLEKASENSKTDLDVLYNLLKEKKQLKISTLARVFNVKEDIVIGWCKTLEASNLVTVEYPTAGDAIVKIVEEREREKEEKD